MASKGPAPRGWPCSPRRFQLDAFHFMCPASKHFEKNWLNTTSGNGGIQLDVLRFMLTQGATANTPREHFVSAGCSQLAGSMPQCLNCVLGAFLLACISGFAQTSGYAHPGLSQNLARFMSEAFLIEIASLSTD